MLSFLSSKAPYYARDAKQVIIAPFHAHQLIIDDIIAYIENKDLLDIVNVLTRGSDWSSNWRIQT